MHQGSEESSSTLPTSIFDHGFYANCSLMKLFHKALQIYASTSWIFDQFKRNPWEVVGGTNWYPAGTQKLEI